MNKSVPSRLTDNLNSLLDDVHLSDDLYHNLARIKQHIQGQKMPYLSDVRQGFLDALAGDDKTVTEFFRQMLEGNYFTRPKRRSTIAERIAELDKFMLSDPDLRSNNSDNTNSSRHGVEVKVDISTGEDDARKDRNHPRQRNQLEIKTVICLAAYRAVEEELIQRGAPINQGDWNEMREQYGDSPLGLIDAYCELTGLANREFIRAQDRSEDEQIDLNIPVAAFDLLIHHAGGYYTGIERLIGHYDAGAVDQDNSLSSDTQTIAGLMSMRLHLGRQLNDGHDGHIPKKIDVKIQNLHPQ
jgi:hypothetical protein